jgi:hypothetical protein
MLFLRAPFFVPETGYAPPSPSLFRAMTVSWVAHLMGSWALLMMLFEKKVRTSGAKNQNVCLHT